MWTFRILSQPEGGTFSFEAEGKELGTVDTSAETRAPGFASFDLPLGSKHFTVAGDQRFGAAVRCGFPARRPREWFTAAWA